MSGFLSRWSARKTAKRQEPTPPEASAALADETVDKAYPDQTLSAAEIDAQSAAEIDAQIAALPAIETITAATDIRPFMQAFVPQALRKAALRKAWAADPIISTHLDVARDYAWEFNEGPLPVGFAEGLGKDAIQRGLDRIYPTQDSDADSNVTAAETTPKTPDAPPPPPCKIEAAPEDQPEIGAQSDTVDAVSANLAPQTHLPATSPGLALLQRGRKHGTALPD